MTLKFWKFDEFKHSLKVFADSLVESAKNLYKGDINAGKWTKHSGKALLGAAALSTVLGVANTLHITKKPSKVKGSNVMNPKKESVVC